MQIEYVVILVGGATAIGAAAHLIKKSLEERHLYNFE